MFGKLTLIIEKSTALASIALTMGICAVIMLKTALEQIITGSSRNPVDKHPRKKGIVLLTVSIFMLIISIIAILEGDQVAKSLSRQLKKVQKNGLATMTSNTPTN